MSDKKELITVILLGLIGAVLWNFYYNSYEKLYTVGEVTGTRVGLKSGTSVQFDFYIEGKKVEGSSWKGSYAANEGKRFIVEFGKTNHSLSSILLYYPIPDSLKIEIPRGGWDEIPEEIKKYRLKRKEDFGLREYFHKD